MRPLAPSHLRVALTTAALAAAAGCVVVQAPPAARPAPAPAPPVARPEPPPAPAPAPPVARPEARCAARGAVLAHLARGDLADGATAPPAATWTIYASGAIATTRGRGLPEVTCATPAERDALAALVRVADVGVVRPEITCRAVSHTRWTLTTPAGRAYWLAPCGADVPTPATAAVSACVLDLAEGRGAARCAPPAEA